MGTSRTRLRRIHVAPARERGLKSVNGPLDVCMKLGRSREGAWIEIPRKANVGQYISVAPARERGLKYSLIRHLLKSVMSLPRGSVD